MNFIPENYEFLLVKRVKDIAMQVRFLLFCYLAEINFHAYTALTELQACKN